MQENEKAPESPAPSAAPAQGQESSTPDPIAPKLEASVTEDKPAALVEYAGFWIRFLALIIDGVILSVVAGIVSTVFGGVGLATLSNQPAEEASPAAAGIFAGLMGIALIINLVIQYGYYVTMTGIYGATVGKMILGLRVVDANGQKIGIGKAALREIIGKWISGIVFGLGYLWVAFDGQKQGWHDKIAQTYVVKKR